MKTLTEPAQPASTESNARLMFDNDTGRWCIGKRELHCGDCFELFADTDTLPPVQVRIEHCSAGWYLLTPYGLTQLSNRRAKL